MNRVFFEDAVKNYDGTCPITQFEGGECSQFSHEQCGKCSIYVIVNKYGDPETWLASDEYLESLPKENDSDIQDNIFIGEFNYNNEIPF